MFQNTVSTIPASAARQQGILTQVYAWMMAGLLVTGATAMYTANTPVLLGIIFGTPLMWVLLIGQVALVWILAANIHKMSSAMATGMFLFYSAMNGLTLSAIFLVYTEASIAVTFFVAGGMFAGMSLYGYTTKADLSAMGSFLVMGLIGFLLASIVNIFLQNDILYWILTYLGIAIFIGLTAYDTQKIKEMAAAASSEDAHRVAILGALTLYLDFVNLFLLLLRLFGSSRD